MFDQAFESFRKATETTVQIQQEMFQKWVGLWMGLSPPAAPGVEQARQFQKKWMEFVGEQFNRQRQVAEAQLQAGVEAIEKGFRLGEAKNVEELRTATLDLWRKCFAALKQTYETQVQECKGALEKWTELVTKPAA
jgi:hypothetical protein